MPAKVGITASKRVKRFFFEKKKQKNFLRFGVVRARSVKEPV
jgi:hypothetical protein